MVERQKLRIVHVLRAPMGGLMRHVRDLSIIHTGLGHDVGIICDVEGTEGYNEALLANLDSKLSLGIHRSPMSRSIGISDLYSASNILKLLNNLSPDIIHGHGAKGGVFARACGTLAKSGNGKPGRLYSPHGGSLHFDPHSRNGRLYFRVERMLEGMTDRLNFVAEFEKNAYSSKVREPKCPSGVIYNGLTEEEFEPIELVESPVDFVFVGELRMLKGPDLFVRAISRLKAEGASEISAVLVGAGPDREEIHEMIKERDIQTNITIRPPMPARAAFQLGRCSVMPSRAEAMPYIVLEALAAQRPLIATNVGGIPEIYGSASDVLVEPAIDPLTARMRQGLENLAQLVERMPEHKPLKDRFSAETMASAMLEAYQESLVHRRGG